MSSIESGNYNYLLKHYYSSNRNARKTYGRATQSNEQLISADSNALKKVATGLKQLEYTSDNGVPIYNNIKAFIDTYNNLADSSAGSKDAKMLRYSKQLKKDIKDMKDELEKIGIKVNSYGKLKLDKVKLMSTAPEKVAAIFSADNEFTSTISARSTKMLRKAKELMSSGTSNRTNSLPVTPSTGAPVTSSFDVIG